MSQVNIQQLLNLNPVSPTQVSPTPVDYSTSSFQGGGFRPGQLAPLPKSSEQSMYEALSNIAGAVGQGIDTFSKITSQIDKERINKVEAEWERLDALDIDPRDKVTEFNKYVSGVETPITGETWKDRIAARVSKSWGKEAFEKFVESEYTEQVKRWPKYDGKMGPVRTQEFLSEFNAKNPSLTGSDFISGLSLGTQAKLREQEDLLTANNLIQAVDTEYKYSPEQISGLANKSLDIEELRKTSPKVVKALELAASSKSSDDFDSAFTRIYYEELVPLLGVLDPEVQYNALLKLDQVRTTLSKELWKSSQIIMQGNNQFKLKSNLDSSLLTFTAAPNQLGLQSLSKEAISLLPDVPVANQRDYLGGIAGAVYSALSSNKWPEHTGFSSLPVNSQIETLEKVLKEVFPEEVLFGSADKPNSGVLKEGALGPVQSYQEAIDQIVKGFVVSKAGVELQGSTLQSIASATETIDAQAKIGMAAGKTITFAALSSDFIKAVSDKTGISSAIIEQIFLVEKKDENGVTVKDENGKVVFQPNLASAQEILKNREVRFALSRAGIGEPQLNEILKLHASLLPTGGGKGGGGKVSLEKSKAPTQEAAQRIVLTSPELIPQALAIISNPNDHDEITLDAADRIVQEASVINGQLAVVAEESVLAYLAGKATGVVQQQAYETSLNAWQKKQAGTATQDELRLADEFEKTQLIPGVQELYGVDSVRQIQFHETDASGKIIPLQPSVLLDRKNWVDDTNRLTPAGRRLGLRLTMEAKLWAGLPQQEGQSQYLINLREKMTALSKAKGLDQADPAVLYSTLYALKGLKSGSTEPIGLVGSNEKNDSIFFDYFLEFMTVGEIPNNLASMDDKTNVYLNALNVALETLNMPQNFGSLDQGLTRGTDSSKDSVIAALTSIGTGNGKSILAEGETPGTAVTLKLGQFFKFPGISGKDSADINAKRILGIFHKISTGILTSDSNTMNGNFIIPSPDSNDSTLYEIPNEDGTVARIAWNKMTPDQQLTWYFGNLLQTNNTELFAAFIYPAVASQIIDTAEFRGPSVSRDVTRMEAVMTLMGARNTYLQRRQKTGAVPFPTVSFVGKGGAWDPTSSWQLVSQFREFLPQVDTRDVKLQPQQLIHDALSASFREGKVLDFNTIESELDGVSQDIEDIAERVASGVHTVSQEKRFGLGKQLDPTDQFVVGIAALPARPETVDYFFDTLGLVDVNNQPITVANLLSRASPKKRAELQKILERSDTGVVSFIANSFPEYMDFIQQRMIQFRLGTGEKSKVRFDVSEDRTEPVLVFSNGEFGSQARADYNVLTLKVKKVPQTSAMLESNKQLEYDGLVRWIVAFEMLKEMQNNPNKWAIKPRMEQQLEKLPPFKWEDVEIAE
jgi:hypothetical protein